MSSSSMSAANPNIIDELINSRELLQQVLCPFENIQRFVQLYTTLGEGIWALRMSRCPLPEECLVAFRLNNLPTELYIDEIDKLEIGTIKFKHYGTFEFNSIRAHYGPIGDEYFEKWLDILVITGDFKLPKHNEKLEKKMDFLRQLVLANFLFNFRRYGILDGVACQHRPQFMPSFVDISRIIIQTGHANPLTLFSRSDFANTLRGLCIQVDITQINHSMILPPMMNLIKFMIIPISSVFFDTTNSQIGIREMEPSMIQLRTINRNGHVICSAQFSRFTQKFPREQFELIQQISLAIWAMNNIPIPTAEFVRRKAAQFRDAMTRYQEARMQANA